MWPTVRAGTNRNSRNAIIGKNTNGEHKSDMGLEQAVEARMGILPKELKSVAELPPRFQKMWPTPTTQEIEHPQAELTETGRRKTKDGKNSHSLGLADAVKMWPTPREFMYKDSTTDRGKGNLGEVVGGQLNPDWVEWLMGFPVGWTDIGE